MSANEPAIAAPAGRGSWRLLRSAAAIATVILVVAVAVVPFCTPLWFFPAQERAQADAWTGWPIETVHAVTGDVLVDLIVGPPAFDQVVDGVPVFTEREQGHLRDVRTALIVFAVIAAIAAAVLAVALWRGRGGTAAWTGIRTGAKVLAIAVVAMGIFAFIAFDTAFALFHAVLFPEGSYTFDPTTERMVQLFPEALWYETAMAAGVLIGVLAVATYALATWRIRRIERTASAAPRLAPDATLP